MKKGGNNAPATVPVPVPGTEIAPADMNLSLNPEIILNRISMVALLIAGVIFIYEGARYVRMKKSNDDIPDKIYAAAVFAIVLGIFEIAFAIWHFWL
jgi:hypothetical protein